MRKTDQYPSAGNNPQNKTQNKTQNMKPTMKKCLLSKCLLPVTAVIGLACLTSSHAATVIWGAAQGITGDSDVATNGTFDRAYIFGDISWTVNGVPFDPFTGNVAGDTMSFPNQDGAFGDGGPGTQYGDLSTAYRNLLYYGAWASPSTTESFTLNNLTIGYSYQVQIFANDSRTAGFGRSMALTGSSTVLDYNTTEAVGGVGQFAIGTFTANSTSQVLGFSSPTDTPQLNGLSLRVTAVPEPSTWAMLSLGLMSILALRRRRHS